MSHRPLILITSSQTEYLGEVAFRLSENYADAVVAAGGLPFAAPLTAHLDVYDELLARADGLLLSGGADLDPACYRDALHLPADELRRDEKLVAGTTPLRDAAELHLLAEAERRDIPVLGICRGAQIMNVAHGGTLYHDLAAQHAPTQGTLALTHNEYMDGRYSHAVTVVAESRLAALVGPGELTVNSLHHQAIRDVGDDLAVSAVASDGVVEAVEQPGARFMLGVQWHPEYHADCKPMANIFHAFVEACAA